MPKYFFKSNIEYMISHADISIDEAIPKMGLDRVKFNRLMKIESLKDQLPFIEEALPSAATFFCVSLDQFCLLQLDRHKKGLLQVALFQSALDEGAELPITRNEFTMHILKSSLTSAKDQLRQFLLAMHQKYLAKKYLASDSVALKEYLISFWHLKNIFISSCRGDF